MTAPANGATVSGAAVAVSANASDNVGVVGVQFKLDGANLGSEDASAPYGVSWNTSLSADGPHSLTAVARDAAGKISTAPAISVTVDNTAPSISGVSASGISTNLASIIWTTNEASDSQVDYGLTTAYGQSSALNSIKVTSHSVGLSGLSGGTLYHYRVKSRDAAGNLATSGDFTFTTASDTTLPTASILSPSNNSSVRKNRNIPVSISALDNIGVQRIELWSDGSFYNSVDFPTPAPSQSATFTWFSGPDIKSHTLQAMAKDTSNNEGVSAIVTVNVQRTGKVSLVSSDASGTVLSETGDSEQAPRALMLSFRQGLNQSLLFDESVQEASLMDMSGRVLTRQSRQGGNLLMPLQGYSAGRLSLESGILMIQMKHDDGKTSIKAMVVVK